jgi:hypothetical protein
LNKKPPLEGRFSFAPKLLNDNLRAWNGLASEFAFFDFGKLDDAVNGCVNGKVAADVRTRTRNLGAASLADQYFASTDFLAAETLDAEALTSVVVDVFTGTTSFHM